MVEKKSTTTKNKTYFSYLVALICAISFYSFELLPDFSDSYLSALNQHKELKRARTKSLNKVKNLTLGTTEYNQYIEVKQQTDIAWNNYKKAKTQESFFGFKSFHFFLERLGLFLGFFMYAIFNLVRSFYFESKNIGNKILHGFIISVCVFYFLWIFQQFQDHSKFYYYSMTFISAGVVVFAVWLITKYQNHYINVLKKNIRKLSAFTFINTKPEKREEMVEMLSDISQKK